MKNQIMPNFPLFRETLPILDEKYIMPNFSLFVEINTWHFGWKAKKDPNFCMKKAKAPPCVCWYLYQQKGDNFW
jgi:hypothetical protein